MSLHTDIKEHATSAMKEKNQTKLDTLRGLVTAITNELVSQKRKPDEELSDDHVLQVLKRQVKQRKDSIEQFIKGGREELAKKEEEELSYLAPYLPEELSKDEILTIIKSKKAELGVTDKNEIGKLMGAVMKEVAGRADGARVKELLSENL